MKKEETYHSSSIEKLLKEKKSSKQGLSKNETKKRFNQKTARDFTNFL